METKKESVECWKVSHHGSFYVTESLKDITAEMESADIGCSFTITRVNMPKTEFEALPEFTGF